MRATESSRFLTVLHSEALNEQRRTFHWEELGESDETISAKYSQSPRVTIK